MRTIFNFYSSCKFDGRIPSESRGRGQVNWRKEKVEDNMKDPLLRRFCLLRRGRSKITQTHTHTHTLDTCILNLFIPIWNAALIIIPESCAQILVPLLFFWHWWSGSGRVFYFGLNDIKCICTSYHDIMTDETRIFGYLEKNFQLSQLGLNLEPALPEYVWNVRKFSLWEA